MPGTGNSYNFVYTYNDVALKSVRYPTMRTTSYEFDRAGRVKSVVAIPLGFPAKTYVTGVDYAAHGAVEQMSLGAGGVRKERTCFNNRLQMVGRVLGETPAADCSAAANTLFRLYNQYGPNNNGNMTGQQIADSGSWFAAQTFTYDKLNRLETAAEGTAGTGWKQSFGYDRYGNRWGATMSPLTRRETSATLRPTPSPTTARIGWWRRPHPPSSKATVMTAKAGG